KGIVLRGVAHGRLPEAVGRDRPPGRQVSPDRPGTKPHRRTSRASCPVVPPERSVHLLFGARRRRVSGRAVTSRVQHPTSCRAFRAMMARSLSFAHWSRCMSFEKVLSWIPGWLGFLALIVIGTLMFIHGVADPLGVGLDS